MRISRALRAMTAAFVAVASVAAHALTFDAERNLLVSELPTGWTLVNTETGQYPYGHHYCSPYKGEKGYKLTLLGPTAVAANWTTESGEKKSTEVGFESIEVWLMPGEYKDAKFAWLCFHRPVQPLHIVDSFNLQAFGRASHYLDPKDKFMKEVLPKATSIRWPDSPATDPALVSWKTWQSDLAKALRPAR